jgi:hypothetical protein
MELYFKTLICITACYLRSPYYSLKKARAMIFPFRGQGLRWPTTYFSCFFLFLAKLSIRKRFARNLQVEQSCCKIEGITTRYLSSNLVSGFPCSRLCDC